MRGSKTRAGKLLPLARVLLKGITPEAMDALSELAQVDAPSFYFERADGSALSEDAGVLALRAAVRDGERQLVKKLKEARRLAAEEQEL